MHVQKILCFKPITLFFLIIAVFSFFSPSFSKDFKFKKIGKSFSHPWGIAVYSDDEVLLTERGGNLFKVNIKLLQITHYNEYKRRFILFI